MSEAADVHDELDQLRKRVAELEATVEELQDNEQSPPGGFDDHRDQVVLDSLDDGQQVTLSDLKTLYRIKTDITNARTLKGRIKSLTSTNQFEHLRPGAWRYTGGDADE